LEFTLRATRGRHDPFAVRTMASILGGHARHHLQVQREWISIRRAPIDFQAWLPQRFSDAQRVRPAAAGQEFFPAGGKSPPAIDFSRQLPHIHTPQGYDALAAHRSISRAAARPRTNWNRLAFGLGLPEGDRVSGDSVSPSSSSSEYRLREFGRRCDRLPGSCSGGWLLRIGGLKS
jgi:hypothetical protein